MVEFCGKPFSFKAAKDQCKNKFEKHWTLKYNDDTFKRRKISDVNRLPAPAAILGAKSWFPTGKASVRSLYQPCH